MNWGLLIDGVQFVILLVYLGAFRYYRDRGAEMVGILDKQHNGLIEHRELLKEDREFMTDLLNRIKELEE